VLHSTGRAAARQRYGALRARGRAQVRDLQASTSAVVFLMPHRVARPIGLSGSAHGLAKRPLLHAQQRAFHLPGLARCNMLVRRDLVAVNAGAVSGR
jgi:hypothetical protein